MGNRANVVIVMDRDWRLYYSRWAGCRILDALIGGPEFALRYVQALRQCPRDQWVDPVWADGGAVVDLDRRRVLFFGDELMVEMAERRALMRVIASVWAGYEICWAYDGTTELAGYVGAALPPHAWDKPLVEVNAVLTRRLRPEDQRRIERLFAVWEIDVVPVDAEQAQIATRAYRDFGRGSGHPAALNLGDCYSYALADVTSEPLLYVGDDFARTDVTAAYRR